MKSFIAPSYTFTPGASGVGSVNLSGISGFDVKYLVSIINQTRGELVYSTASATLKFTNVTGTTVTLFKDTSAMNASDVLQVIYEVQSQVLPTGAATEAKQDTGNSSLSSINTKLPAQVGGKVPVETGLVQSLTDAQLRATPVPVSTASLPLPSGASTEAKQDIGNTSLSSIDTKTPTLDNSKQPVIPSMTTGGHLSATTDAVGTNWVALSSQALKQLTVSNQSGTNLEFRQGGAGVGFIIPFGAMFTFFGITNANELEVRRADVSNTQVTVTARWES